MHFLQTTIWECKENPSSLFESFCFGMIYGWFIISAVARKQKQCTEIDIQWVFIFLTFSQKQSENFLMQATDIYSLQHGQEILFDAFQGVCSTLYLKRNTQGIKYL